MTATLIALLVERGDLAWDLKLCELLPEIAGEMHDDFVDVTLVELLTHRAGVSNDVAREGLWDRCVKREGSEVDQRRLLVRTVLSWPPEHPPRTKYLYSNPGIAIAGHVAETVTGKPYEELMQELLFAPLGITTAGFGAPGSAEAIDQPRGHGGNGKPVTPGPAADNPPAIAPAGTAHMSLADWGRYVSLHLRGAKGDVKVGEITLRAETIAKLHEPFAGPGERYAMGWMVTERPWAGADPTVIAHSGSNTMWYCAAWLAPGAGFAVLATSNGSLAVAAGPVDRAASLVIESRESLLPRSGPKDSDGKE
jgi:CubicO group peptidase (beta-lactamase class C family)